MFEKEDSKWLILQLDKEDDPNGIRDIFSTAQKKYGSLLDTHLLSILQDDSVSNTVKYNISWIIGTLIEDKTAILETLIGMLSDSKKSVRYYSAMTLHMCGRVVNQHITLIMNTYSKENEVLIRELLTLIIRNCVSEDLIDKLKELYEKEKIHYLKFELAYTIAHFEEKEGFGFDKLFDLQKQKKLTKQQIERLNFLKTIKEVKVMVNETIKDLSSVIKDKETIERRIKQDETIQNTEMTNFLISLGREIVQIKENQEVQIEKLDSIELSARNKPPQSDQKALTPKQVIEWFEVKDFILGKKRGWILFISFALISIVDFLIEKLASSEGWFPVVDNLAFAAISIIVIIFVILSILTAKGIIN